MKKLLILAIVCLSLLANCAIGLNGSLYYNVTENATLINKDTSQKEGVGSKEGEACASAYLGIVATGNAGIKAAAVAGGIKDVKAMDHKTRRILGSLIVTECTKVYGE